MTLNAWSQDAVFEDVPSIAHIAIIRDGDSVYFDELAELFKAELNNLASSQQVPYSIDDFNANYDAEQLSRYFQQSLEDPSVVLIFANGVLATEHALQLAYSGLNKPVIGGALQLSESKKGIISSKGTSTLPNYTFIANPRRVNADIEKISQLSDSDSIHVFIDEIYFPYLNERLTLAKDVFEKQLGLQIDFIPSSPDITETFQRVPDDVQAAYVTLLPRLTDEEKKQLYQGLVERKVPSIAMSGLRGVTLGALAGLAPNNIQGVARRAAINAHFILAGKPAEELPVYLPLQDVFYINQTTAKNINWAPDYDTGLSAQFIDDTAELLIEENLNLLQALQIAENNNINVSIAQAEQSQTEAAVTAVRSALLPQVNTQATYSRTRISDRISSMTTPDYAHQEDLGIQLKQVLFNDELWSNFRSQKKVDEASAFNTHSTQLDAIEAAAAAYFNCLAAQQLYRIAKENLSLSENNYHLAKLRIDIGSAEPSEEYRWEQIRVQARAELITRESERRNAIVNLNRVLGQPREKNWRFADITFEEHQLYFMDEYLLPKIKNSLDFEQLGQFLKAFAIDNAPELMAFDLEIAAQGIVLGQKKRRYYLPEIALSADATYVIKGSEFNDTDSENQYVLGLQATFPIFEGYRRGAEIRREQAAIRELKARREQAVQQIEERAIVSFNAIRSGHPNIRLSRRALIAAEQNYESVSEKYSQGAASILDLLDAQDAMLNQRERVTFALYNYLTDVFTLQRSIAWFEHTKTVQEKIEWSQLTQQ